MRAVVSPVVISLTLASACGTEERTDQLTVVVEAERTRALADQARLAEMQASLADAKRELEATRADLTALREKLLQAGALSAEEAKKLEEREQSLARKEASIASAPASGAPVAAPSGLSRADVEELLRAQEERLRASLAGTASTPRGASGPEGDEVADALATVLELRARRGLRPEDVEGGVELERKIGDAVRRKKSAEALDLVKQLTSKTQATVVSAAFVKRKYDRAQAHLGRLTGETKERAKAMLGDANAKNARGDHAGANEALNVVLDLGD